MKKFIAILLCFVFCFGACILFLYGIVADEYATLYKCLSVPCLFAALACAHLFNNADKNDVRKAN